MRFRSSLKKAPCDRAAIFNQSCSVKSHLLFFFRQEATKKGPSTRHKNFTIQEKLLPRNRGLFIRVCLKSPLSFLFFFGSETHRNPMLRLSEKSMVRKHCHYNMGCSWKFFLIRTFCSMEFSQTLFFLKSQFGSFVESRTKTVYENVFKTLRFVNFFVLVHDVFHKLLESDLSFCFEKTLSTVKVSWKL